MPIDKRIPRALNSDADSKAIDKLSMLDALNLYSGPDNEGFKVGGSKLDAGDQVLKNIRGNLKIAEVDGLPSSARLIGSIEDSKVDVTYLFIFSSQASSQGIWAYDRYGKLPGSQENSLRLIYKSKQFNFSSNAFVKADIVYSNATKSIYSDDPVFDKDAIIYFTDGENEPRKINAYRALQAGGSNIHGSDIYAEADFITACPKTPLLPITFKFDNEPGVILKRSVNNFERSPGFQFAYQHLYVDGAESSISSYSDVAIPFSIVDQGSQTFPNHPNYRCLLTIPAAGPEVERVRILGRQGNNGSFLIIDEIESSEEVQEYAFFNDRVLKGVSVNEVNKQFDSVPRKARTQAISSNRLMYGNYLDGFNKSGTTAAAKVRYIERPQDFLSFDILCTPSSYHEDGQNENAAFVLDFSQLPDFLPAETQLSISFSFSPDRNFHVYSNKGAGQSRQRGPQPINPVDEFYSGVNFQQSLAVSSQQNGSDLFITSETGSYYNGTIWGQDHTANQVSSVTSNSNWRLREKPLINDFNYDQEFDTRQSQEANFGLSATNPFIFKGGTIQFSAEIKTNQDISDARSKVRDAVVTCFTVPDLPPGSLFGLGISVISSQAESSYSFDLGLSSGDTISQYFVGQDGGSGQPHQNSDRIIAVHGNKTTQESGVPTGFFIVNKATPTFKLKSIEEDFSGYLGVQPTAHFGIKLSSFEGAEWLTCIRETATSSFVDVDTKWLVISNADLDALWSNYGGIENWMLAQNYGEEYVSNHLGFGNSPGVQNASDERAFRSYAGYGHQIGKLSSGVNTLLDISDDLVIMDGEGGPGGGPAKDGGNGHPYDALKMYAQGSVTCAPLVVNNFSMPGMSQPETMYNYLQTAFYAGLVSPSAVFYAEFPGNFTSLNQQAAFNEVPDAQRRVTTLPFLRNNGFYGFAYQLPTGVGEENSELEEDSVNFKRNQSVIELVGNNGATVSLPGGTGFGAESFKTEANHDFGIVYYDQRGRHGFVDHLDTAFVEGYSDQERPNMERGRVEIDIQLSGEPPEWAHTYKIVYAKNSSVQDFIQYSAGGAFVIENPDDNNIEGNNRNIYVSLNYLQGHPISYVSSFGARTPEGGLNFYKFEEGDKLRVISYGPANGRVYANHDFDVVDLVILGDTENPLSIEPESSQKGQFVVLKDNPNAPGFSYESVQNGTNNWNKNCIFELRTPKKLQDTDEQIYYEASKSYRVLRTPSQNRVHEEPIVTIDKGDVWFRPVATNVRNFVNGEFQDIIDDNDGNDAAPQPNFTNVFMETVSANDLFRSDTHSYIGRPNFIFEDAKETVREATITYSEPSNPEGNKLNYSSFNASLANFKDLPERFGGIQYMSDYEDFLFVLQEDKVSIVPVNRNILSDASGNNTIIASTEILGKAVFYPGRNGCDNDPSSVFDSGEEAYFCNKTLSKVYRWTKGSGVEEISNKGVSSMIRASIERLISEGEDVRIVGGYDPLKDEYLFTLLNPAQRQVSGVIKILQPMQPQEPGGLDGGGDGEPETNNISVDVETIDFAETTLGEQSEKEINISAEGTNVVFVSGISSSDTSITFPRFTPFYIDPSEISTPFTPVSIVFNPRSIGDFSGEITITTESVTNQEVLIPVTSMVVAPSSPLSDFQQAWNDFYEANEDLRPSEYPLQTDEDMSAELAFNYINDLRINSPEEIQWIQLRDFLSSFESSSMFMMASDAAVNSDNIVGVPELLLFQGMFDYRYGDYISMNVSESIHAAVGGPGPGGGGPGDPDQSGGVPPPFNFEGNPPDSLFSSTQEALDFIVSSANMNVLQFHYFNSFIKPKIKADFNGDGVVGTGDLMDLLQYYATSIPGAGDPAFINPAPVDLEGPASDSTSEALLWLLANGSDMTAQQYWDFASNIRLDVKTDINGDGIVGTNDHMVVLSEWSSEQAGGPENPPSGAETGPLDPNTLAFN